jgi:hypothetical protein
MFKGTVIPALGRLRQKDHDFEASLGCRVRSYLKRQNDILELFLWAHVHQQVSQKKWLPLDPEDGHSDMETTVLSCLQVH